MIPEQKPGENLFVYVLRSAQEIRDNRQGTLQESTARILQRARVSGHQAPAQEGQPEHRTE